MSVFKYNERIKRRRRFRFALIGLLFLLILTVVLSVGWYYQSIKPYKPGEESTKIVTVDPGATEDFIGTKLEDEEIIRSAIAYRLYLRLTRNQGTLQAGDYELSPSMSVAEVVGTLSKGEIKTTLFTILPARRIDQLEAQFKEAGYSEAEIIEALDADSYKGHPALADKPDSASLEGYLYPESFQIIPSTPLKEIIKLSLDEMAEVLTPFLKADLQTNHGLTPHQAIILASVVEREVSNPEDRGKVAQVFLKRYKENIALGSDPTALFGAVLFGLEPSVFTDTPYNTRLYPGLPPGPINNVSIESLRAVADPAETDFLFFVSGDDGNTYFSNTQAEHEALAAQYCIELCRSY